MTSDITPPERASISSMDTDELYAMLDIASEMIGFCSCWMSAERYYAVANAIWVIAHRAAGNDAEANELKSDLMAARARYFAVGQPSSAVATMIEYGEG